MKLHKLEIKIAVLEAELACTRKAREVQAIEYERRLSAVNDRYVSRDAWEIHNTKTEEWKRTIDQWRWISIGAGVVGGGLAATITKLLGP